MRYEASIKITLPRFVVRVWRELESDKTYKRAEHADLEALAYANQEVELSELARLLLAAPGVVSVEVHDWNQCGVRFVA